MIAVRLPTGVSSVAMCTIAIVASLSVRSPSRKLVIAHPELSIAVKEPSPAIDIDELAAECDGGTDYVPYIEMPWKDPPRTREEAIDRDRGGILGMYVPRPCHRRVRKPECVDEDADECADADEIDNATSAIIATSPGVAWSYTTQPMTAADVARRKADVAAWLAEGGFGAARDVELGSVHAATRGEPATITFAEANIAVTANGEVWRNKHLVGRAARVEGFISAAYWVPSLHTILIAGRPGQGTDRVWVVVTNLAS
jgi:hypothetical protein